MVWLLHGWQFLCISILYKKTKLVKQTLALLLCCCRRSGHRKYSLGRPDQRDLSENLAATQGLANMISEAQRLFQVPKKTI